MITDHHGMIEKKTLLKLCNIVQSLQQQQQQQQQQLLQQQLV